MIKSLAEKIISKQSHNDLHLFLNKMCVIRFGSEEKAKKEVHKLSKNGVLDEDGFNKLMELLYLDKIYELLKPLSETTGLISMIKGAQVFQNKSTDLLETLNDDEKLILRKYVENLTSKKDSLNFFFPGESTTVQNKLMNSLIEKQLLTSKGKISDEIGVDKSTLNKWLKFFFRNKFKNARRISLKDYFKILLKISLRKDETKSFISNNLEEYVLRLDTDLVHNRGSLLKIDGMDDLYYKSLKENLQLKNLDSSMKKIPFSIKEQIVTELS